MGFCVSYITTEYVPLANLGLRNTCEGGVLKCDPAALATRDGVVLSKQCREIPIFLLVHTVKDVNSTEYRVREKKRV
jgi:hypothetical protein